MPRSSTYVRIEQLHLKSTKFLENPIMNGKKITKLGFSGIRIGKALEAVTALEALSVPETEILALLARVRENPREFLTHESVAPLARIQLEEDSKHLASDVDALRENALPYAVWGAELIDPQARVQMETALRLSISVAGALMPDAHVGYGLPIGGVLATVGAVIPYGVGVDIGCSMRISVFPKVKLSSEEEKKLLEKHTRFGAGVAWDKRERLDHQVLDDELWTSSGLLSSLLDKAVGQLGTSGSGNHFVEFGTFTLEHPDLNLEPGEYLAVLSHSGSRGTGAQIAGHFSKLAEKIHPHLHPSAKKLAWLSLEAQEGQDYWQAMSLAGRYALANHEIIHARLSRALDLEPLLTVSNSHNLAWKQTLEDGTGHSFEAIVHRKGATPASRGQLGIIPGSMADNGYLVRGLGSMGALESASHGAGRRLGRRQAEQTLSKGEWRKTLLERDITLIGGGIDEAPLAYKPIDEVMAAQTDLVQKVGKFTPRTVRMDTGSDDV